MNEVVLEALGRALQRREKASLSEVYIEVLKARRMTRKEVAAALYALYREGRVTRQYRCGCKGGPLWMLREEAGDDSQNTHNAQEEAPQARPEPYPHS